MKAAYVFRSLVKPAVFAMVGDPLVVMPEWQIRGLDVWPGRDVRFPRSSKALVQQGDRVWTVPLFTLMLSRFQRSRVEAWAKAEAVAYPSTRRLRRRLRMRPMRAIGLNAIALLGAGQRIAFSRRRRYPSAFDDQPIGAKPARFASMPEPTQDELKGRVATRALDFVQNGMRLGLGSGSTAKIFVAQLAEKVRGGLDIICVPTSEITRAQAEAEGIPLTTLDETPELDLVIDGADEFDERLRLIKGGGGALLREKIVAAASNAMVVIADQSKQVERLGRFPLPVEVNVFGLGATTRLMEQAYHRLGLAGPIVLRRAKGSVEPFKTDGGHLILDCHLDAIFDPERLAEALFDIPGVVEHGLFIGLATTVIVADATETRVIGKSS